MRYLDKDGGPVTIYKSNDFRGGLKWAVDQVIQDLTSSRYVIFYLFKRDFVTQFRQKIFGYFWLVLGPFLGIVSFLFLYFIGVLKPGEGEIPYVLYVLLGSMIWGCFPGAMAAVSGGLQSHSDLILRTRIPKIVLSICSLANIFYSLAINMVTVLVVMLIIGARPSWWILAYPFLVLPMLMLGTAFGLVLSVFGTIAKDLTFFVTQGVSLLMYFTPVIYVHSTIESKVVRSIIEWNPVTYLVDVPRSLVCIGISDHGGSYLLISSIIFLLLVLSVRVFYLVEDLVVERL